MRLSAERAWETAFATDGKAEFPEGLFQHFAEDVAIAGTGAIVVAGIGYEAHGLGYVQKLSDSGAETFASTEHRRRPSDYDTLSSMRVAAASDGGFTLSGGATEYPSGIPGAFAHRFTAANALDPAFSGDGITFPRFAELAPPVTQPAGDPAVQPQRRAGRREEVQEGEEEARSERLLQEVQEEEEEGPLTGCVSLAAMTEPELKDKVEELIGDHEVLLFMKGTPRRRSAASRCGWSACSSRWASSTPPSTCCPPWSRCARPPARSPTGAPSPSSTSRASWSAAADIVEEMAESGELAELLGADQPDPDAAHGQAGTAVGGPAAEPADADRELLGRRRRPAPQRSVRRRRPARRSLPSP